MGKGVELRGFQTIWLAFGVHRLPGGQQQDELAGHACLVAQQALAVAGLWRHHLPGVADSWRQRADDAGGGGGGYVVLGARAELIERGAAGQPLTQRVLLKIGEAVGFKR